MWRKINNHNLKSIITGRIISMDPANTELEFEVMDLLYNYVWAIDTETKLILKIFPVSDLIFDWSVKEPDPVMEKSVQDLL